MYEKLCGTMLCGKAQRVVFFPDAQSLYLPWARSAMATAKLHRSLELILTQGGSVCEGGIYNARMLL